MSTTDTVARNNIDISIREEKSASSCTKFEHSEKWLAGPRLSNKNETDMSEELVLSLIMGGMPRDMNNGADDALGQTMCYAQSRIRTWDPLEEFQDEAWPSAKSTNHIRYLVYKLLFLAIHENQHRPAKAEALARYGPDRETSCAPEDVGTFDFQCDPQTKYIVAGLGHNRGMGIIIKTNAVEPFLFSLMTDRVLLWNNLSKSNFFSCDRKDWQCLFMPMSPCVLTQEEMKNGTVLSSKELIQFRKEGKLPAHLEDERVIIVVTYNYREEPKGIRETIVRHIDALIDRKEELNKTTTISSDASSTSASKKPWNLDSATLDMVKDFILDGTSDDFHRWFIWRPGMMYMLRPNLRLRARLDTFIEDSVPKDFDPNKSIGIPIRAGDKCRREQVCYGFEKYIQVAAEMGAKRRNQTSNIYDTIVLTSESRDMVESRLNYTSTHPNATHPEFPFRFIVNEKDVMQGHGQPRNYHSQAEEIMVSTLSVMKFQLLTETLVSNSCSNFHKLLAVFHGAGCGMSKEPYSESLTAIDNPELRMKCKI